MTNSLRQTFTRRLLTTLRDALWEDSRLRDYAKPTNFLADEDCADFFTDSEDVRVGLFHFGDGIYRMRFTLPLFYVEVNLAAADAGCFIREVLRRLTERESPSRWN